MRYQFINRAGLLVKPNGRATLDVGNNPILRERFQTIEQAIGVHPELWTRGMLGFPPPEENRDEEEQIQ